MNADEKTTALDRAVDQAIVEIETAFGRPFGRHPTILPLTYENVLAVVRANPGEHDPEIKAAKHMKETYGLYESIAHACLFRHCRTAWRRRYVLTHELTHAFVENNWPEANTRPDDLFKQWTQSKSGTALEEWFASHALAEGIAEHVTYITGVQNGESAALTHERRFPRRLKAAWALAGDAMRRVELLNEEDGGLWDSDEFYEDDLWPTQADIEKETEMTRHEAEETLNDIGYIIGEALVKRAHERTGDLSTAVDGLVRTPPSTFADIWRRYA